MNVLYALTNIIFGIGLFFIFKFFFWILYNFYNLLFFQHNYKKLKGTWAVVTGASDGIGKGFCHSLGKRGINIVLISRTKSKLEAVASECERKYKIKTIVLAGNFLEDKVFSDFERLLKDEKINVTMLINNVGGVHLEGKESKKKGVFRKYHEYSFIEEKKITRLNIVTPMKMVKIIVPYFLRKKIRGKVLNIGSFSSLFPQFLVPYATAKTRLNGFTEAIVQEYPEVEIQLHMCGEVNTNTLKTKPSLFVPNPEVFAESSLRMFGSFGSRAIVVPYLNHFLQHSMVAVLPSFVKNLIINKVYESKRKQTM